MEHITPIISSSGTTLIHTISLFSLTHPQRNIKHSWQRLSLSRVLNHPISATRTPGNSLVKLLHPTPNITQASHHPSPSQEPVFRTITSWVDARHLSLTQRPLTRLQFSSQVPSRIDPPTWLSSMSSPVPRGTSLAPSVAPLTTAYPDPRSPG